ncbi:hypothetical protein ACIRL3_15800 [Streptomyces sp. NPDC102384]|uniref:hypothetical protein n=1 Tax=unclassified Streptomyces TaxID=2593676 RepID=UPI00382D72D5
MPIPNDAPPPLLELHADVVAPTKGDLVWTRADPLDPAARRSLPRQYGVYCWAARHHGGIYYFGCSSAQEGLWKRLGTQLRWVREGAELAAQGVDPAHAADNWDPFSRFMVTMNAEAWWAATDEPQEARTWESLLLQQSIRLTGVVPAVNGGAWYRSLESRAWAQRAAGSVQFGPAAT